MWIVAGVFNLETSMNKREFLRWWTDYCERFPMTQKWIERLGDEAHDKLLAVWAETLAEVDVHAAMAINRAMSSGDLEPVPHYDEAREQTALRIRRAVQEQDRVKRGAKVPAGPPPPIRGAKAASERRKGPAMSMRQAMSEVARLVRSGEDRRAAVRQVCGESTGDGQLHECWLCRDTGLATVWSVRSMRAFRSDPSLLDHPAYRRTMVCPCECSRGEWHIASGEAVPHAWASWTSDGARYTPSRWCPCTDPDDPSEIADFRAWAGLYFEKIDQQRAERMSVGMYDQGD